MVFRLTRRETPGLLPLRGKDRKRPYEHNLTPCGRSQETTANRPDTVVGELAIVGPNGIAPGSRNSSYLLC
jgi:hypothetical protein